MRRRVRVLVWASSAFFSLWARNAVADPNADIPPPITKPVAETRFELTSSYDLYLRAATTWSTLGGQDKQGSNLGGGIAWAGTMRKPGSWLTFAFDAELAGGAGDSDADGVIRSYTFIGIEPPTRGRVIPFARAGAGFDYRGNDQYLASRLDLPVGQVGVTVMRDDVMFRLGALGAYTATGRFDVGPGTERVLDGAFAWGAFADARGTIVPLALRSELRSFGPPGAANGAPLEWTSRLCLEVESIILCMDGAYMRGSVQVTNASTPTDAALGYAGVSLGGGSVLSRL
jgi:hypothetical protein